MVHGNPLSGRPTLKVAADDLKTFISDLLLAEGCEQSVADLVADHFLEADLRGIGLQGLDHIFTMLSNLRSGRIDPKGRPHIVRDAPAFALIDGGRGPGQLAGILAADLAAEKAKLAGIAAVGVMNSADLFMIGIYVEQMARQDVVGFAFSDSAPLVHALGGNERVLGTNPLAFGACTSEPDPFIFDMATSSVSQSRIRQAAYHHEEVPPGLGVDANGEPTTSAENILAGAIAPGGHKGFGLAIMVALLSGPLVGADVGWDVATGSKGHLFLAIDPNAFTDVDRFRHAAAKYLQTIQSSRRPPRSPEIRVPGQRSFSCREESLANGVSILEAVWERAVQAASERKVAVPRSWKF